MISSELEVDAPFKFGIGGEVFDVDLAEGEDEALQDTVEVAPVADGVPPVTRTVRPVKLKCTMSVVAVVMRRGSF